MELVAGLPLPGDPNRDAVGWWGCGLWPQGLGRKGAAEVTPQGAGPWVLGPGTKWGREESERPNRSLSFLRMEGWTRESAAGLRMEESPGEQAGMSVLGIPVP